MDKKDQMPAIRPDSQTTLILGEESQEEREDVQSVSRLSRSLSWSREEMLTDMLFQEFPDEGLMIGDQELADFVRSYFMCKKPDPDFIAIGQLRIDYSLKLPACFMLVV